MRSLSGEDDREQGREHSNVSRDGGGCERIPASTFICTLFSMTPAGIGHCAWTSLANDFDAPDPPVFQGKVTSDVHRPIPVSTIRADIDTVLHEILPYPDAFLR